MRGYVIARSRAVKCTRLTSGEYSTGEVRSEDAKTLLMRVAEVKPEVKPEKRPFFKKIF